MSNHLLLILVFQTLRITCFSQEMIRDINPGNSNSNPDYLVNVNGTLFFSATDATKGNELWKSNGTTNTTTRVKDIVPGLVGSEPKYLTDVNGTLFFNATTETGKKELWKSDGTVAGTVIVKLINQEPGNLTGSNPTKLTNVNGVLFFCANDGVNGYELWKSDGTDSGTVLVKDIYPGQSSSDPNDFIDINGELFFSADYNSTGRNLWKSDGTEVGTIMVKDICNTTNRPWSCCPMFTKVNGKLFFVPIDNSMNSLGSELWTSDGTETGTVLVENIRIGEGGISRHFWAIGDWLFFSAANGNYGSELWKSDGTNAGTVLVKDIYPGTWSSFPNRFISLNGVLYFQANNGNLGFELWRSDGSTSGTYLVWDIVGGSESTSPFFLITFNNALYFRGFSSAGPYATYRTDGTSLGTVQLPVDLSYTVVNNNGLETSPAYATIDYTLFYTKTSLNTGKELWKYEPTSVGLEEFEKSEAELALFPNPNSGKFNLYSSKNLQNAAITIYDTKGQIVHQSSEWANFIDISSQPSGIYTLKIEGLNEVYYKKIVLE